MNFNDTEEEALFRQQAREWLEKNIPPASEIAGMDQFELAKYWFRKRSEDGWTCFTWPKEYGGRGGSPILDVIWEQEEMRLGAPASQMMGVHKLAGPILMTHGTEAQRAKYLPKMVSGEQHWTQIFSEPSAGSDVAGLRTRATRTEGGWLINGQKIWTTNAHRADMGILVTRTDPTVPKHKGLSFFVIDMKSEGIECRPIRQINGGADFNEIFFNDVFIPDEDMVGQPGDGWKVVITALLVERFTAYEENSDMYFDSKHLIELAHLLDENGSSVLEDSDLQSRLADWYCLDAGLKYMNYRLITSLSRGETPGPENSMIKLIAASKSQEVASYGLDLLEQCGVGPGGDELGEAYRRFFQAYMTTPGTRILGGTDEVLLNTVAERVLGMPGEISVDKGVPFNKIPTSA